MLAIAGLLLGLVAVANGLQPGLQPTPQLRSTRRAVHVRSHALAVATPLSMPSDGDSASSNLADLPLKILYDGKCMVRCAPCPRRWSRGSDGSPHGSTIVRASTSHAQVCLTNKAVLSFFDRRHTKISFVDIRDDGYSPSSNAGVAFADAMRHLHVITADGQVRRRPPLMLLLLHAESSEEFLPSKIS